MKDQLLRFVDEGRIARWAVDEDGDGRFVWRAPMR